MPINGAASPDAAEPSLPARPRELRIDSLDPCDALTSVQLVSLGVKFSGAVEPGARRGPGCAWKHSPTEPVETYTIDANTRGGVELVFGQAQLDVVSIAGFGAVETPALYSRGEHECIINVDVAPGQAVQISYFYDGSTVPMDHEIACQKARNAAELAMQTILARAGG
jgi:Protein of unknown function (DUF3558)